MKHGLVAAVIGLALVAGCGNGDSTQSLAAQLPEECRGGWTEYPADGDDSIAARCQKFFDDHPELEASLFPTSRPAPVASATSEAAPTDSPAPIAILSAPAVVSASPRPRATATTDSGQVSASPASTTKPTPSRTAEPRPRSTPSPSQSAAPLLITEEDNGKTFETSRSTSDAVLRLGGSFYNWSPPELEGTSIRLNQRQFFRDPGYSEWEIQPVSSGTTVIRSTGNPKCRDAEPPCGAPSILFEVRINVR